MVKKRWNELSERSRRLIVAATVGEVLLKAAALIDLKRRPAAEIRGSKRAWGATVAFVNSLGAVPIAYFLFGRRKPADD
ncbi:hypothetical protein [Actinocorallia aurantiaca]|uniref:DUF5652 domain-containing protein n=1 Tax=Actinocorallia aurantiaca TaxID=46204 RepID=A0ABP6GYN4_9ACTN